MKSCNTCKYYGDGNSKCCFGIGVSNIIRWDYNKDYCNRWKDKNKQIEHLKADFHGPDSSINLFNKINEIIEVVNEINKKENR